jgi:hypothetical protein
MGNDAFILYNHRYRNNVNGESRSEMAESTPPKNSRQIRHYNSTIPNAI